MLRQQIRNIQSNTKPTVRSTSSAATGTSDDNDEVEISIEKKAFHRIGNNGTTIIFNDNTTAQLLSPAPFIRWNTKNKPDANGTATISKDIKATVLSLGKTRVVIGYDPVDCGVCNEFEYLVDLGDTEVAITNEYLSIKAKTLARNGVEIDE